MPALAALRCPINSAYTDVLALLLLDAEELVHDSNDREPHAQLASKTNCNRTRNIGSAVAASLAVVLCSFLGLLELATRTSSDAPLPVSPGFNINPPGFASRVRWTVSVPTDVGRSPHGKGTGKGGVREEGGGCTAGVSTSRRGLCLPLGLVVRYTSSVDTQQPECGR